MGSPAISTLVVDDEPIARKVLREELELFLDILVVGEAENGRQALQKIAELKPDLVFLDLQMPLMGGFEVVRALSGEHLPVIIIVTAYDEYAIEAFEAGAVDYLLKPVSEARLSKAVARARALHRSPLENANAVAAVSALSNVAAAGLPSAPPAGRKIVARKGHDYVLLDPEDILAFQAEDELVWIVTGRQRFLATQSLRMLQDHLRDSRFQRVHRNAIVNVNHIRKMSVMSSQRWLVTLSNSLQVIVSKRMAHNIRGLLKW